MSELRDNLRCGVKYSFFDYINSVKGNLKARFHICLTSSELEILASVVQLLEIKIEIALCTKFGNWTSVNLRISKMNPKVESWNFRCLMQTIMVSLTLQSLWRWEYQNNVFFVKVEIPKTKICEGPGDVHNEECGEREKASIPFRHLRHRRRWTHLQQWAVQGEKMSTALPSQYL